MSTRCVSYAPMGEVYHELLEVDGPRHNYVGTVFFVRCSNCNRVLLQQLCGQSAVTHNRKCKCYDFTDELRFAIDVVCPANVQWEN